MVCTNNVYWPHQVFLSFTNFIVSLCGTSMLCWCAGCLLSTLVQQTTTTTTANAIEQSPSWEVNRSSANQKISSILWNPKVQYYIPKCPPPSPILRQSNPVHASPSNFFEIHFNIIDPSVSRCLKSTLSVRSPHRNPVCASPVLHMCHMHHPSHLALINLVRGTDPKANNNNSNNNSNINPLEHTAGCETVETSMSFACNSSFLSDGLTCLIPFESWRNTLSNGVSYV